MPGADGTVLIKTEIDNKEAQKQLDGLKKDIKRSERDVGNIEAKRNPLVDQMQEYGAALDEAKAKLDALQNEQAKSASILSGETEVSGEVYADTFARSGPLNVELKQSQIEVDKLQKKWDSLASRVEGYDAKLKSANATLEQQKIAAGELEQRINGVGFGSENMARAQEQAEKAAKRFVQRLKTLATRALIFTVITRALAKLRDLVAANLKTNEEYAAQLAQLKGAWLTAFQPIWSVIVPALLTLMRILTAIGAILARVFSFFSGKGTKEVADNAKALADERAALEGVGGAADDASKSLAGFDEINKLSDSSGGGGGGGAEAIAPDFGFLDDVSARMENIAKAVMLIAAGFALWKLGHNLVGGLSTLLTILGGLLIAVGGVVLAFDGLNDAWENGVDWGNLAEMLLGVTAAATGLYLAFGKIASGILLVIAGGVMIVTAFRDIIENGANLQNTLLLIAGIVATGLGFFFLTGNVIPLVIAGIASVVFAILGLTGNLDEFATNFKDNILGGIITFLTGVFKGDWEAAWEGLKSVFAGVWNGIIMLLESAINFIVTGLNKISFSVPDWVPEIGGMSFGFNLSPVSLPRLATGAVIPPNREFMAVLGDQKSGYNIEAPEELIRRIVREEGGKGNGNMTLVFEGELAPLAALLRPYLMQEDKRVGVTLATGGGFTR